MYKKSYFSLLWLPSLIVLLVFLTQCRQGVKEVRFPPMYRPFPVDTTLTFLQSFPKKVSENSGLQLINGQLWTHNDSGDDPVLYQMSIETGDIIRSVSLDGANAIDWEDITASESHVFVGDFGNNNGRRQDLVIYKSSIEDLLATDNQEIASQAIAFSYPDRVDFSPLPYQHNFDCEAIVAVDTLLYLFSKNHLNKKTRLYQLNQDSSMQEAVLLDSFDTRGMITGAAWDGSNRILAMVGYNLEPKYGNFGPFVWLFWDFEATDFFGEKSLRVNLPWIAQMEGITHYKDGKFLVSCEASRQMRGKLLEINALHWIEHYQ